MLKNPPIQQTPKESNNTFTTIVSSQGNFPIQNVLKSKTNGQITSGCSYSMKNIRPRSLMSSRSSLSMSGNHRVKNGNHV